MNILVTGGAGYIGSCCVRELIEKGYNVIVLDSLEKGFKESLPNNVKFIKGNLNDKKLLREVFKENKIEAVIDLAGYIEVNESMNRPLKYYENNVLHVLNLLDIMIENDVKKLVYSSSAAVYGNPEKVPIKEDDEKRPNNVYGETKLIAERILDYYDKKFGLKFISLRYFNAAGATKEIGETHEPETHLIPIVLQVVLGKRDKIKIFGEDYKTEDGSCVRDYVHVKDLANAHILALEHLFKKAKSEHFNVGTGRGYSVKEIIKVAREITGHKIPAEISNRREGDPAILVADCNKINKVLGLKANNSDLKNIIKTAWEWHKNNPEGYKK